MTPFLLFFGILALFFVATDYAFRKIKAAEAARPPFADYKIRRREFWVTAGFGILSLISVIVFYESMPESFACHETIWQEAYIGLWLSPIELAIFALAYARIKRGLPVGSVIAGTVLTGLGAGAITLLITLPLGFRCFSF